MMLRVERRDGVSDVEEFDGAKVVAVLHPSAR